MNVKDRIINNAVQRFVETPVSAPSYYDLNADDGLIQYKDDETKEIFGETHVHYRWVDYAGTLELMSFTQGDCVWRFGSIDPSKDPSDILNLNGVNPDDPSTFNESFFICDENNICKHPDSDFPLAYKERPSLLNTIKESVTNNESSFDSSFIAPEEVIEEEVFKDPYSMLEETDDSIHIDNTTTDTPTIEIPSVIQPKEVQSHHVPSVSKPAVSSVSNPPSRSVISTSTVHSLPSRTPARVFVPPARSGVNPAPKPLTQYSTKTTSHYRSGISSNSVPVTTTQNRPVVTSQARPQSSSLRQGTGLVKPVSSSSLSHSTTNTTTRQQTYSGLRPVTTKSSYVPTHPSTSKSSPSLSTTTKPTPISSHSTTTKPTPISSYSTTTKPTPISSHSTTTKPTPISSHSTTTKPTPVSSYSTTTKPTPSVTRPTSVQPQTSVRSYMRDTKASIAQRRDVEVSSTTHVSRPPIGRVINPVTFSQGTRRIGTVTYSGERPTPYGSSHGVVVAPLTGNRTRSVLK